MRPNDRTGTKKPDGPKPECRISVIIPAHNSADFIDKTLKMIMHQAVGHFEIIVVDDGSDDDTCIVVKDMFSGTERKDIGLRLLRQEHSGVSSARNHGMEEANGEYVMFFDSDDIMDADCLGKLYSVLDKMRHDTVVFGIDIVDGNGRMLSRYYVKHTYFESGTGGKDVLKLFLLHRVNICVGNIIHNRAFLMRNDLSFNVGSQRGEDAEFNLKSLYLSKSVGCVPETLIKYVQRHGSLSKTAPHIFEPNSAKTRMREFLTGNDASDDIIELIDTRTIPESYRTTLHALRHAGVPFSEVKKLATEEEIRLLLKHNSSPLTNRVMLFMYLHTPKLLFLLTRMQHKLALLSY